MKGLVYDKQERKIVADKVSSAADDDAPDATDSAVELAREHDIDLSTVTGTGASGRITKKDVQSAVDASAE